MTFAELTRDAHRRVEVVARFLAVLVFFKQGVLQFGRPGHSRRCIWRWVEDARDAGVVDIAEGDFA